MIMVIMSSPNMRTYPSARLTSPGCVQKPEQPQTQEEVGLGGRQRLQVPGVNIEKDMENTMGKAFEW